MNYEPALIANNSRRGYLSYTSPGGRVANRHELPIGWKLRAGNGRMDVVDWKAGCVRWKIVYALRGHQIHLS
jgi:hypothetical protein